MYIYIYNQASYVHIYTYNICIYICVWASVAQMVKILPTAQGPELDPWWKTPWRGMTTPVFLPRKGISWTEELVGYSQEFAKCLDMTED